MKTMRKSKICRYGLIAFVFFCLTVIGSVCLRNPSAVASAESTTQTVYIGDSIEAASYKLSYNGGSVKAEGFTVVYPSGGVYGGKSFSVEQAGNYAVTYYANVDGKRIEETQNYIAVRTPKDIIYSTDGATIGYGKYEVESPYKMVKETYGALVTFKAGTSIEFSTTIPTEKLTADYNIIDMIVMPSVFRETDFEKLTMCITDANDPTNYIEILIISSDVLDGNGQVTYVRAGANGQQYGGYEGSDFHTTHHGTQVEHSFRAFGYNGKVYKEGVTDLRKLEENQTISEQSLTIAIDNAERKVYCGPRSFDSKDNLLVNDLDDPTRYKGNPWGGFTSDEVTVKIVSGAFMKATGQMIIKSFGDYNLAKDIEDTVAPKITLDYDMSKQLPIAKVGAQFPIIPFTVKDALDTNIKTNVYVYYLAPNGQKINVSHNGRSFFVEREGDYEIVYRAEDYSGYSSEESVIITAYKNAAQIFLALDGTDVSAEIYDKISVKEASDVKVFGGYGDLRVERAVYSPSGELLDIKNELLLTELGDYKIVYKATDYLEQVEYGIVTVHSTAVAKPTFIQAPDFDKVLIKGFKYALTQPLVVEVVDGKVVEVPCKVYVNGELMNGNFTADGDAVEIKYVAEGTSGTSEWKTNLPVVDTEKGKYQSRYFLTEGNIAVTDDANGVNLTFTGDSKVEFIKELDAHEFLFNFSYDNNVANFKSMNIVLTNAQDKKLTITFAFTYDATLNSWTMQVNGTGAKVAFAISKSNFGFTMAQNGLIVKDSSGNSIATVKQYDNGEPFDGFCFSDALYFGLEFGGVTDSSSIQITKICNQPFGFGKGGIEKAKDEIKPVIVLEEEFVRRQDLNTKAKIPMAVAYDVLGQITSFTITIQDASGNVLLSGAANEPVDFFLDKAGVYTVIYYAKDSNGKYAKQTFELKVYDETAPTLTITDSLKKEYKVGDKITIPTYSAKDNGENCTIQVELILPNNELRLLHYVENGTVTSLLASDNVLYNSSFKADENTFIVEQEGTYTLRFLAYDEYYNVVSYEMSFKVVK